MTESMRANIAVLGEDLRNSFNNRLQEISAMISAARVLPPETLDDCDAYTRIDEAVRDIALSVNRLEDRILDMFEKS